MVMQAAHRGNGGGLWLSKVKTTTRAVTMSLALINASSGTTSCQVESIAVAAIHFTFQGRVSQTVSERSKPFVDNDTTKLFEIHILAIHT